MATETSIVRSSNGREGRERWLVTGGAGFFGTHMCRLLVDRGHEVISYDLARIPLQENVHGVAEIVGDIRDRPRLREALQGVQYVVHAAAALALAPREEIDQVNAEGTRIVLETCIDAGVRRVVYIGTTAVYGMPKYHPIFEEAELEPMGSYGVAKARAERYCLASRGLEVVRIRPKSFIGTGRLGIFQILFDWIDAGKRIYIIGRGHNRFQLLEVEDLVECVYKAMHKGKPGHVYNVGALEFGTVNEDVGALLAHAGTGSTIVHIPSWLAKSVLRVLEVLRLSPIYRWVYDTADQDSYVSIEKARRDLDWAPRHSNRDALIRTYDWYHREGKSWVGPTGTSHRTAWEQGVLKILKAIS